MSNVVAIIPARGGSKGIPKKNLIAFCGKPLLVWSIEQALAAKEIHSVWVSSDDDEILDVAKQYGANPIRRPHSIAGDTASSESAWLHGIDTIMDSGLKIRAVVGMQATSPLRKARDLDDAVRFFFSNRYDSLFSASPLGDFFIWRQKADHTLESLNYDYRNRSRRQDISELQVVENGSFYIFTPDGLLQTGNRLSGNIGYFNMEFWKCFEINNTDDVKLCAAVMSSFLL